MEFSNYSIYDKAIVRWGVDSQIMKAMEEMGELMQAISKQSRGDGTPEQVLEEIVDVNILMKQLYIIYNCRAEKNVSQENLLKEKLCKLQKAINKEN